MGAISPSTGRTLPDRYIEGTCPICGYDSARGDQCDNCGNQLDPIDLINPRSRGSTARRRSSSRPSTSSSTCRPSPRRCGEWLDTREGWRPNVLRFSRNLLDDLQPRAITRDLDWGVPIPLDGWRDRSDKRIYVWFDAVIGYLSASIEWARRSGDPRGVAELRWCGSARRRSRRRRPAYYFMGKDNIVFHSVIWPALLLGYYGEGARGGEPGELGRLNLPTEVVSSEFLTMEGRKFSSSRQVVIYVRDFLERYDADALRYFIAVAGPESNDTDFTWAEFLRRNNDELVAGWGNLVNRSRLDGGEELRRDPAGRPGRAHRGRRGAARRRPDRVRHGRRPDRAAPAEGRRSARRCGWSPRPTSTSPSRRPWKLKDEADKPRMGTILHVALQVVSDANTLLTPFLPHSAQQVHELLGGTGVHAPMPEIEQVDDLDGGPAYPVLTGDYTVGARWESVPIEAGRPLATPKPVFRKLDPSIVDEELARLAD